MLVPGVLGQVPPRSWDPYSEHRGFARSNQPAATRESLYVPACRVCAGKYMIGDILYLLFYMLR